MQDTQYYLQPNKDLQKILFGFVLVAMACIMLTVKISYKHFQENKDNLPTKELDNMPQPQNLANEHLKKYHRKH